MKLLALAVLLTVMQASPPVPRKATDNSTQATAQIKSNGTDGNQQSVSISKLPTVTVAAPKRDLADWGYWAFSGLLVIVGFLQVLLLWRTLRAIQRQADDMGRQVDLAFGQLRAMHEQITEMSAQTDVLEKSVTVAQESANTARENFEAYKPTEEVSFRNTLKPGDIATSLLIWMNFTEEEEKDIESGDLSLHIFGRITYDDRFGIGRVTPFWYIWDQHASLVVPEANHWEEWHEWMFGGSREDNQPT
jgi:hypothetical protein